MTAAEMVELGRTLWGPPNIPLSTKSEARFGTNGSKKICLTKLVWHDHEANTGGGFRDLYHLVWGAYPENGAKQPKAREVASYDYRDEAGTLLFQVVRLDPKSFPQRRPDGKWGIKGIRRVLYRLPELLAAPIEATVYVVEGEKDVDRLRALGLVATCNPGGAAKHKDKTKPYNGKWRPEYNEHLRGRHVTILPDNDAPGTDHARAVARKLTGIAASVRILDLPGLPLKGDVSDWLNAGGTAEALEALAREAPEAGPEPKAEAATDDATDIITEGSVATSFASRHRDKLRFDHTVMRWFEWDSIRWRQEKTRMAYRYAHDLAKLLAADDKASVIVQAGKASFARGVETIAQTDRAVAVTHEIWDRDLWLLGTPGGTVDLRTSEVRAARREDYITKLTGVAPAAPRTPHPVWTKFLHEATQGDKDLQRFLQQMMGYCLTGSTKEHALFFVYGPGKNGKSVFLTVLAGILGDYGTNAAMDTFTATQSDRHPTDLAKLAGARLVTATETEEGRAWAEAKIKQMTGGDILSARFMRQDFFDFLPLFKLVIVGNHKPVLRNVDEAARRRFNIIPFTHTPPVPDKDLDQKLRAEWPAILAWGIAGALDWQENGLIRPAVVVAATDEYFSEQDLVTRWMEDCCDRGGRNVSDTAANLFASWKDYAIANGEVPGTSKWFNQILQRQGAEPIRDTPGHRNKRGFLRISVKPVDVSGQWQNAGGYDR